MPLAFAKIIVVLSISNYKFITMKLKVISICLICSVFIGFSQLPNYVPANGLVGFWPFNGNANDESNNNNNGTRRDAIQIIRP